MIKKTLNLKCELTIEEINDIAKEMSSQLNQKSEVALNKARAMKQFSGEMKYWDNMINKNNILITDGFEYRNIDCEVVFNSPVTGQKIIKRLDNQEEWQEQMTIEEFDLFNITNIPTDEKLIQDTLNYEEE